MNTKLLKNQSRVSLVAVVIITVIIVLGGYAVFMFMASDVPEDDVMMNDGTMMELKFSGQVLAGTSSPLLDFNKVDYDKAVASGKLVAIYFYANWCPICKAEFPKMQEAFNKISDDKVVGFRVNYNDDQTDDDERELAREFGVAYQHTKVFVKNSQRILKAPESWNSADVYISKINQYK